MHIVRLYTLYIAIHCRASWVCFTFYVLIYKHIPCIYIIVNVYVACVYIRIMSDIICLDIVWNYNSSLDGLCRYGMHGLCAWGLIHSKQCEQSTLQNITVITMTGVYIIIIIASMKGDTYVYIQHTTHYSQHTAQQNMSNIVSMICTSITWSWTGSEGAGP